MPPAPHGAAILSQLTDAYLDNYTPLAIAEVLKKWMVQVDPVFHAGHTQQVLQCAAQQGPMRAQSIREVLETVELEGQGIVAHIMHLCHALWANEGVTKTNKNKLAYVFGPVFFRQNMDNPAELMTASMNIKKLNSAVEEMIQSSSTVCQTGIQYLSQRGSAARRDSAPVMMSSRAGASQIAAALSRPNPMVRF
jgi:hypothetical protein